MSTVQGAIPAHPKGKPPKTDDRTRTCRHDDCDTRLSRYNLGAYCWLHSDVTYRRTRGKPTK